MPRLFSTLVPKVAPSVLGCPPPTIEAYIRDTVIRVCERTLYWKEQLDSITLVDDTLEYSYGAPAGTVVHAVMLTQVNRQEVPILSVVDTLREFPDWDDTPNGQPTTVCQIDTDTVAMFPPPDDEDTYVLDLFVALKPTRAATSIPQVVFDEIEETVVHGVLQHLLVMPNVSWTDRELAAYHARQYLFHLSMLRNRTDYGDVRRGITARMQPFG